MLISLVAEGDRFPESAAAASGRLKAAVAVVLRRAQDSGAVRPSVTVEEVYLLIRGLAQATATAPVATDTLDRAIEIVLTGLAVDPSPVDSSSVISGSVISGSVEAFPGHAGGAPHS
jgi:hypothetical protein